MNLKKFIVLSLSSVIALASLFSLGLGGEANATGINLWWCGSGGNFSSAANWSTVSGSCNGGNSPANGDSLIFTDSSSGVDPINDISNLDVNSIAFQGSGASGFNIVQLDSSDPTQAITVDTGITDSGSGGATNQISAGINLNGSPNNISVSGSDKLTLSGSLNLGTNSLTISSGSSMVTLSNLDGSGSLTFASPTSGVAYYVVNTANSSSFSGPVSINSNANVSDTSGNLNGLGSGTITVNSGGSLTLNSSGGSGTLANNLVLAGSGDGIANYGALVSCLGSCTSSSTLNLSGSVTLTGNTQVVNGAYTPGNPPASVATFNFTGKVNYGGHSLSAVGSSSTVVNLPSNSSGSSGAKAPGSPNSGEGLVSSHTNLIILGTLMVSSGLVIIGIFSNRSKSRSPKK